MYRDVVLHAIKTHMVCSEAQALAAPYRDQHGDLSELIDEALRLFRDQTKTWTFIQRRLQLPQQVINDIVVHIAAGEGGSSKKVTAFNSAEASKYQPRRRRSTSRKPWQGSAKPSFRPDPIHQNRPLAESYSVPKTASVLEPITCNEVRLSKIDTVFKLNMCFPFTPEHERQRRVLTPRSSYIDGTRVKIPLSREATRGVWFTISSRRLFNRDGRSVVFVDPLKIEKFFQANKDQYIGPLCHYGPAADRNGDGEFRYQRAVQFLETKGVELGIIASHAVLQDVLSRKMIAPLAVDVRGPAVTSNAMIRFVDGTHRFTVLRDAGFKAIPLVVPYIQAEIFNLHCAPDPECPLPPVEELSGTEFQQWR